MTFNTRFNLHYARSFADHYRKGDVKATKFYELRRCTDWCVWLNGAH